MSLNVWVGLEEAISRLVSSSVTLELQYGFVSLPADMMGMWRQKSQTALALSKPA
jgi:hypothetical protein